MMLGAVAQVKFRGAFVRYLPGLDESPPLSEKGLRAAKGPRRTAPPVRFS